ncbi:MAG: O-antigen ligase family protein [Candidatus Buchananbacteria bacterium]|nr:O-antigen ligase family protein [Candidatus Buchananbacteria bacterium]
MNNKFVTNCLKAIIWLCLTVILFSPLYLDSHLFFPFIITKTIAFNVAVEIMFLAWLFLCFKDNNYKIKFNLAVVLMAVYILIIFISSLLGDNFYHSFWSNNERSEGILLLLHLFVFLLVLTNFFRQFKNWLYIFDIFLAASLLVSLYAIGQFFHLSWLPESSGGIRLAGTIGNAGYMAGYMIFGIFFGLVLFFNRRNIYLKLYYAATIALEIFIVFNTYTRGGILALLFSGLLFVLYILFYFFKNKALKIAGLVVIAIALLLTILLFQNKDSSFVQNNQVLVRIASISTKTTTAQTRLMAWNSAFQGFKERPILGWGYENFYQPFDKYFNPNMYEDVGSVVWFDRAHNIIFDRLLTGGLLGLLTYLSLLFLPFYCFWRHYFEIENKNKYFMPFIFTLVILSYFIQNLFIFEALVTYIPLFLALAFASLFTPHYNFKVFNGRNFKLGLLIFFLVLFLPILYLVNIKPLQANVDLVTVLTDSKMNASQRIDLFKSLLAKNTYGNPEYRLQLFNFLNNVISSKSADQDVLVDLAKFTDIEINKQVTENPYSVSNYLLLMRFNNFLFNSTGSIDYVMKNIDVLAEKAKILAPNRQHVYFEIGYSYFNLANYFKKTDNDAKFKEAFQLAVSQFEKAVALNEKSAEPYKQLATVLSLGGQNERAIEMAQKAGALHPTYATWAESFIKDLQVKAK